MTSNTFDFKSISHQLLSNCILACVVKQNIPAAIAFFVIRK